MATLRPNLAIHALDNGSELTIVPVATPSAMRAPEALRSRSVKVSSPSSTTSSSTGTRTVFPVSPGAKLSLPLVRV